jgi:disulfide bond formation protein DsbB
VTSDTTVVSRAKVMRGDADPVVLASLAIMVIAAATIGGAWFFQLVLDIQPCPLCLEQRYAYYAIIPLAALIALAARRGGPRGVLILGLAVLLIIGLGNAAFGTYHAGVEWGFWKGPTDCTGPLVDFGKAGNLLDQLDKVKVIRCDEVQWRFLGLSLAGYNALISLTMAAVAGFGMVRTARS